MSKLVNSLKFLITQGANIHANDGEALRNAASKNHNDVWQVLSDFIQEEKLPVAASVSTGASHCLHGTSARSASTRVCSTPQTQVLAPVNSDAATSGTEIATCAGSLFNGILAPPQKSSSVDVAQAQPLSTTKIKRSKI